MIKVALFLQVNRTWQVQVTREKSYPLYGGYDFSHPIPHPHKKQMLVRSQCMWRWKNLEGVKGAILAGRVNLSQPLRYKIKHPMINLGCITNLYYPCFPAKPQHLQAVATPVTTKQ